MTTGDKQQHHQSMDFMRLNPVFTLADFARHLESPVRRAQYRVRYFLKEGRVKRLANGVYATVPVGAEASQFQPDVYLAAAAIRPDAVFAYHSALDLLGQAHSVWWTCTVCTSQPRPPVVLGRHTIKFLGHPSAVRNRVRTAPPGGKPQHSWNTEVSRGGRSLCVTTPERTLVDGFRELGLVGGVDELVESMDGFASLKPEVLRDLLHAHENKRLWAAVGWYLQRRRRHLFLDDSTLRTFQPHRPKTRTYLVPGQRGGVLVPDWNLIVPEHLQRSVTGEFDGS